MGGLECASAQVCAEVCVCACVYVQRLKHTHFFFKHKQELRSCACRALCLLSDCLSLQVLLIQSKECTGFYIVHISLSLSPPPPMALVAILI